MYDDSIGGPFGSDHASRPRVGILLKAFTTFKHTAIANIQML